MIRKLYNYCFNNIAFIHEISDKILVCGNQENYLHFFNYKTGITSKIIEDAHESSIWGI